MNLSKNSFSFKIICFNCSVKVIAIVDIGTEKQILKNAPLNKAKKPSFLIKRLKPWKTFLYPKTESWRLPPLWATSALCICILSFTISNGVVAQPAIDPATDEQRILYPKVGFYFSLTKLAFIFSKAVKNMALKGPKNSKVAPNAYLDEKVPCKAQSSLQICVFFAWPQLEICKSIILFMTEPAFVPWWYQLAARESKRPFQRQTLQSSGKQRDNFEKTETHEKFTSYLLKKCFVCS